MSEGFAAVPTWMIRDKQVPRNAILVYASLSSRAGYGAIFPSQATIAAESGLSERTVRTMLGNLEALGLVKRRSRRGKEGRANTRTDAYTLHPNGRTEEPADIAGRSELPANDEQATGNQQHSTPYIEIDKEEIEKSEISDETRPDVERLLDLLDFELVLNGVKRLPARNKKNRDAIRLMIDRDGISEQDIAGAIRWCQADEFWRGNILSASKLREKYETLRAQASRKGRPSTADNLAVVAKFEAAEQRELTK